MKQFRESLGNGKGFTLIEVILVVIILSLLAAMVVPRLAGRSKRARAAIAKTDILANIPMALDLYELDIGAFPSTEQGLTALRRKPSGGPILDKWAGPYLKTEPVDPWNNLYQYRFPGIRNPDGYDLFSHGPDGEPGGGDDIANWDIPDAEAP